MNAIRILKHLDSEILELPELRSMVGKDVEIIVLDAAMLSDKTSPADDADSEARRTALQGTLISYDDPFGPAAPLEDWSAFSDDWNTYK